MLTLLKNVASRKGIYRCSCGNEIEAFRYNVSSGHTASCGCLRRKVTSERSKTHGHKSGGQRSKAYATWVNMRQRCTNPKTKSYGDYGARGIKVCERWRSFENFLADMGEPGPGMSIDRIDNMGDYGPDNCRWATPAQQGLNKRNCVRYEHAGKNLTLGEWAKETGIGRLTLLARLQRGLTIELALSTAKYLKVNR